MRASSYTLKFTNVLFCLFDDLTSCLEQQTRCIPKETLQSCFNVTHIAHDLTFDSDILFIIFALSVCHINEAKTYEMGFLHNIQWAKLAQASYKVFLMKTDLSRRRTTHLPCHAIFFFLTLHLFYFFLFGPVSLTFLLSVYFTHYNE